ncbi:MAG: prolyl aminopeptidase, partial [Pseudomonadota bacterium]
PEAWEKFLQPIPGNERDHLISAYYQRLTSPDKSVQIEAAQAWAIWEGSTVSLHPSPQRIQGFSNEHFAHAFARIECHYFINRGFFEYDGWILDHAHRLTSIPGIIVQGRYDVVTPPKTAWQLHRAWLGSVLNIVPDAGHAAGEDGTIAELVKATDLFADRQ